MAKTFDVDEKNVYSVPQMDYHLDLSIRPVGYPDVLVNDPELALKNLEELARDPAMGTNNHDFDYLKELYDETKECAERLYKKYGNNTDDVVNYLKAQGFNPIRVGAVYGAGFYKDPFFQLVKGFYEPEGNGDTDGCKINFINAIVNKRPDGSLSYITNGTTGSNVDKLLEKKFEEQLKEKVPTEVAKVHFVYGSKTDPYMEELPSIASGLRTHNAGIHCHVAEEPDFNVVA